MYLKSAHYTKENGPAGNAELLSKYADQLQTTPDEKITTYEAKITTLEEEVDITFFNPSNYS